MSASTLARALGARGRLFQPFLVLGDPDPETCVELAVRAVAGGASALELGLPYGAASADGAEVAGAYRRALARGATLRDGFACLVRIRARVDVPLNLLVYGNLVHARGVRRFCAEARAHGASSLLVPDVPVEESEPLVRACAETGLGSAQLVGPRTTPARLRRIASRADAYLYLVSRPAVTGSTDALDETALACVERVASAAPLPVCVGFGLSRPNDVARVLARGARLAVVGSALLRSVRAFACGVLGRDELVTGFEESCRAFAAAARAPEDARC